MPIRKRPLAPAADAAVPASVSPPAARELVFRKCRRLTGWDMFGSSMERARAQAAKESAELNIARPGSRRNRRPRPPILPQDELSIAYDLPQKLDRAADAATAGNAGKVICHWGLRIANWSLK
jgi:hypothetical protein